MAVVINSFDTWLSNKLQELNTDESVFGSYIKGILEGDETEDEKNEALEGIIAGITEDNIGTHVSEILSAWLKWSPNDDAATSTVVPTEDVEVRLAKLLDSQNLPTTCKRTACSLEERRIREAILAQYSEMTDDDESDAEGEDDEGGGCGAGGGGGSGDGGIEKNTNAANIAQQLKEKRERAKLESQEKKEKDKKDREKQKQLKEEKKEKRKTVKGERRR